MVGEAPSPVLPPWKTHTRFSGTSPTARSLKPSPLTSRVVPQAPSRSAERAPTVNCQVGDGAVTTAPSVSPASCQKTTPGPRSSAGVKLVPVTSVVTSTRAQARSAQSVTRALVTAPGSTHRSVGRREVTVAVESGDKGRGVVKTHTPPDRVKPAAQVLPQAVPSQVATALAGTGQTAQAVPHPRTEVLLAQEVPQAWYPALHTLPQAVPSQVASPLRGTGHGSQEVPQARIERLLRQAVEQRWKPVRQRQSQKDIPGRVVQKDVPFGGGAGHDEQPGQDDPPPGQAQRPDEQTWRPEQAIPHAPQL